jgi:hypothetical protein
MARGYRDEDIVVTLLRHIREIFEGHGVARIASAALVEALLDLEDAPGPNGAAPKMISRPGG